MKLKGSQADFFQGNEFKIHLQILVILLGLKMILNVHNISI